MGAPGIVFLVVMCLLLPYAAVKSAFRVRKAGKAPTRGQYLASVAMTQGCSLVLALSAARYEGVELFGPAHAGASVVLAAAGFLVVGLGTLPARWAWKPREEKERTIWIYPHRAGDLWWWVLVSLTAGVVEEIVFRGVMFALWARLLGSWWGAVAVCVAVFALAHFTQGWRAMAAIAVLSLGMHGIVLLSGDLYMAMAVHAVYDVAAGATVMRMARREGILARSAA